MKLTNQIYIGLKKSWHLKLDFVGSLVPNLKSSTFSSHSLYNQPHISHIQISNQKQQKQKTHNHPSSTKTTKFSLFSSKLATNQASLEEIEGENNKRVVVALYDALAKKDIKTAHHLLAPDLEWWFHGPPSHQQHLMSLLTGQSSSSSAKPNNKSFIFHPLSNVVAFGSMVFVEGFNKDWNVSWVHAWTVTNGIITQVREYFNTSVTVTRFGDGGSSISSSSPGISSTASCQSVWESKVSDNKSVPGLVLAL